MEEGDFISFGEAELMVDALQFTKMEKVGSRDWKKQHEYLSKLNQQAQLNAQSGTTEFISELLSRKKIMKILIYELLSFELWRHRVIPIIIKTKDFSPKSTLPIYTSLYHETIIVNLLETILFSGDACEALEDYAIDLVDYCYRTISFLLSVQNDKKEKMAETPRDVYNRFISTTLIEYGPKCISIIRYLSESGDRVPLDTHSRIIQKLNFPQLIVELLDNQCPWIDGDSYYQSSKWQKCDKILNPHQIGLLLLLRQLLLSEEIKKYEFHNQNITSLMRVQKYLTPNVIDFCSPLADLAQFLSQIQMGPREPVKSVGLIIEAEPEARDQIDQLYKTKYSAIAKHAMKTWLNPTQDQIHKDAKEFMATWDFDKLEQLIDEVPKCEKCGSEATSRCGKCKRIWYCRRQCQVEDWSGHKKICALLAEPRKP